MSNVGKICPSEMESYIDKKTGREIIRLTKSGTNMHFYFTENSFTWGDKEILYKHMDEKVGSGPEKFDLFSMNLETGESIQITDIENDFGPDARVNIRTKSKDSRYIILTVNGDLYCLDRKDNQLRLLYRAPVGFHLGQPNLSYDNRYVAITATDDISGYVKKAESSENYGGFKESFYAHKNGYIILVRMDGSGGDIVFEDTHWLAHVQFAPDTNEFLTYCHEGPWNYVQQRIWMLNTVTRHVKPCFIQDEDDSVGHEFWTRDGLVFFDNRGKGHDGTITADKTQAVTIPEDGPDAIPCIGFADKDCNIVKQIEVPYYCNHYHASMDNTLLVADATDDIVLIDISGDKASIRTLCEHNTSWRWQQVHAHPCWSWSNDKILFASDRDKEGYPQLYLVKMK